MKIQYLMVTGLLAIGMSNIAVAASDLTLDNHTEHFVTSRINPQNAVGGVCSSTVLGDNGITKPGQIGHKITATNLRTACVGYWSNCVAVVYYSKDCSGDKVATVKFDINNGLTGEPVMEEKYKNYSIKKESGPFHIAIRKLSK